MIKSIFKLLLASTLILFIVAGFFGQNLLVNASSANTIAPKPAAATIAKTDGPAIGGLKNCNVDRGVVLTPTQGNDRLKSCLKDIINLVIVIAVLISVASLVVYGIQLMNPMETSGKVQTQIATRITELAVGGVILGMFGTILATINPATLNTSQVFGKSAIENFQRYIGIGQGTTNAGVSTGTGATPGAGGTTTSGGSTDPALKLVITNLKFDKAKFDKLSDAEKKPISILLQKLVDKEDECTDLFSDVNSCTGYTPIEPVFKKSLEEGGIKSSIKDDPNLKQLPGPLVTNYKIVSIVSSNDDPSNGNYVLTYDDKTTQIITIRGGVDLCKNIPTTPIDAGKVFIPSGCSVVVGKK